MDELFGKNIKFLRERAGLSQEQFGKLFGKTKSCISLWESNERSPIVQNVLDIANHFNVDILELISADLSAVDSARLFNQKELAIIEAYRQCDDSKKEAIYNMVMAMVK